MIGRLIGLVVGVAAVAGLFYLVQDHRADPPRVLHYEPGTYQGPPDQPLDAAQQEALRARARQQNLL